MNNNNTTTVKSYISNIILKDNPAFYELNIYRYTENKKTIFKKKKIESDYKYILQLKNKKLKIFKTPDYAHFQELINNELDQVLNYKIACIYDESTTFATAQVF